MFNDNQFGRATEESPAKVMTETNLNVAFKMQWQLNSETQINEDKGWKTSLDQWSFVNVTYS